MKICIVCSSGGHFFQMYSLSELWNQYDRIWITFPGNDTGYLLKGETVYHSYYPTNRNLKNAIKNFFLAFKILRQERPKVIISTGAGIAVPFMLVGKLLNIRTIYIESMTRVHDLSLSGKILYPFVDQFLVQWPDVAKKYSKALFRGRVI